MVKADGLHVLFAGEGIIRDGGRGQRARLDGLGLGLAQSLGDLGRVLVVRTDHFPDLLLAEVVLQGAVRLGEASFLREVEGLQAQQYDVLHTLLLQGLDLLEALGVLAHEEEELRVAHACTGAARVELQVFPHVGGGLVEITLLEPGFRAAAPGRRKAGVERDGVVVFLDGGGEVVRPVVHEGLARQRFGVLRLQFHGLLVVLQRRRAVARVAPEEGIALEDVGLGILGVQFDGLLHQGQGRCVVRIAAGQQALGLLPVGGRYLLFAVFVGLQRGHLRGTGELLLGLGRLALPTQHLAQAGVVERELRIHIDPLAVGGLRAVGTVVGVVVLAHVEPGLAVGGAGFHNGLECLGGMLELLLVRKLDGLLQLRKTAKSNAGKADGQKGLHERLNAQGTISTSRDGMLMGATPSLRMIRCPLWLATKETKPVPRPLFPSMTIILTVRRNG